MRRSIQAEIDDLKQKERELKKKHKLDLVGAGGREVPKVEAGERHHADPLQREGPGAEVEHPQNHRAQEDHGAHQADPQLRHGVPEPGTVRNDDPDRIQEIYTQQVPGRQ